MTETTTETKAAKPAKATKAAKADTAFNTIVAFTIDVEGGYHNDPRDPGGETKYGIAKRYHPDVSIPELTPEGAAAIYREEYWDALRCGDMPMALAAMVFDFAVNPGQGAAAISLQEALRVKRDGIVGPKTIAAAQAYAKDRERLMELVWTVGAARLAYWSNSPVFRTNKTGWRKRILELAAFIATECGEAA